MNVIINADDLGLSVDVNERIFELIEKRRVTSSTILTSAPAFEHAAERIHRYPYASFGIHLNLTECQPLAPAAALQPLLNDEGAFARRIHGIWVARELSDAIFDEWSAQIERARQAGIAVSHFDSHHQVHTVPSLFLVLKRVQKKFGIWKVRRSRDLLGAGEDMSKRLQLAKAAWNAAVSAWGPTKTTDAFTSFASFYSLLPDSLPQMRSVELMCHPGDPHYEAETRLLSGPWSAGFEGRLRLISYNEL